MSNLHLVIFLFYFSIATALFDIVVVVCLFGPASPDGVDQTPVPTPPSFQQSITFFILSPPRKKEKTIPLQQIQYPYLQKKKLSFCYLTDRY